MNPDLAHLHPYPFEKLRALFDGLPSTHALSPIRLSIGEPEHPTPALIREALVQALDGLALYPATQGGAPLRQAIAGWLERRYGLPSVNPETQVLPVNGSREALFAFAQCLIDRSAPQALVVCPNPFYQIYEGAALLAGAQPFYLAQTPEEDYALNLERIPQALRPHLQLLYVCSPSNPTGKVLSLEDWKTVFEWADRYDFVVASDECYSEIYTDEAAPPLGALAAAQRLGREDFARLVVFSSLSKRSNVPGLRSGFVAGDAALLKTFLRYRTYHGCAMSPTVQAASIAGWCDEVHVIENRRLYREKFEAVTPILAPVLDVRLPDAGFYLWAGTPMPDTDFARGLQAAYNVTVLPGRFLGRHIDGHNPGENRVRIALVAPTHACIEAAERIAAFVRSRG